jgi:hypothetical protein
LIGLAASAPPTVARSERVLCPIRRMTGRPCPGCGLSRSWYAALHGRPRASLAFHPLGPAALALVAAYAAGLDERPGTVRDTLRRPAVAPAFVLVWLAVWLLRLQRGWTGD